MKWTSAQLGFGETLNGCEWHIHATGKGADLSVEVGFKFAAL